MKEDTIDQEAIVQSEKLGLKDFLIAGAMALGFVALQFCWEYPWMHPSAWSDAAVAAGARPAVSIAHGYWTAFATFIYSLFGLSGGNLVLRLLGHVVLAGLTVTVYGVLREMLTFIMRAHPQVSRHRTMVMRLAAAVGTFLLITSQRMWVAGQFLSESTILIALVFAASEFFFAFLRKGKLRYAYITAILLGLLSAESPIGFVLLVIFIVLNLCVLKFMPILESPFFKPAVMATGKWYMTFFFVAALGLGLAIDLHSFFAHDGLVAGSLAVGDIPLKYGRELWTLLAGAATGPGWIAFLLCLVCALVGLVLFIKASDEEQLLSYAAGIVYLVLGVGILVGPFGPFPKLWLWTYMPVNAPVLETMGMTLLALTIATAATVLGVDVFCRNHRRLAREKFGVSEEDEEDGTVSRGRYRKIRTTRIMSYAVLVISTAFILVWVLPGRYLGSTRAMLAISKATIDEIVDELPVRTGANGESAPMYLFTDGNLDDAVEFTAKERGKFVYCEAMVGGGPLAVYLRKRGLSEDAEDLFSFKFDAAMGLRGWIRDRPERLDRAAVQIGFDLWKRAGKPLPPMGGLLSLPAGYADENARLASVERGRALAIETLKLASRYALKNAPDKEVSERFFDVMWRLSRMCRYRGEKSDLSGDVQNAVFEIDLEKKMNEANETYQALLKKFEKRNQEMNQKLTPREGLQLALVRADFTTGKVFAEMILQVEPENPDANFALGMHYMQERQFSRAESYLRRCLIKRPKEPAIYNNLAMIELEQGRLDAAETNAKKALELIPGSAAVIDTLKAIEKARAKAELD